MKKLQIFEPGPEVFSAQTVSVDFDGTTEFMANTTETTIGFGPSFTIAAWVKPLDVGGTQFVFDVKRTTGNADRIQVRTNDNSPRIRIFDSAGSATPIKDFQWADGATGTENVWQFMTFTYNVTGAVLKGYFDGSEDTPGVKFQDNAGSRSANPAMAVGVAGTTGGGSLNNARMLYVATWDKALSSAEVSAIYNGGDGGAFDLQVDSGSYASSSSLKHWWRLGQVSSDIGKDSVTSGGINIGDNAVDVSAADIVVDAPP